MARTSRAAWIVLATLASGGCDAPASAPLAPETLAASRGAPQGCRNVRGVDLAQFTSPTTAVGVLEGDLAGAFEAEILSTRPGDDGSIHLVAQRTIVNEQGTIRTSDSGVLSPVEGSLYRANGQYTFVGGTGLYEDVSGGIRIHGDVDLGTGRVDLRYFGRVCT